MDDRAVPVVSYARISADTARDEHGVADQHKVNRDTAARLGWTVVHEITDNDRSASKLSVVREGFEQLLRILWSGHLPDGTSARGVVVVADDRLARRSGDYERSWMRSRIKRVVCTPTLAAVRICTRRTLRAWV
jgi:hypothetical protein